MFTCVAFCVDGHHHKLVAWFTKFPLERGVIEAIGGPNF